VTVRPTAPTRPAAPVTRIGFGMFFSPMRSVNRKTDLLSGGFDQARVRAVNDDHV
jgi:hypothetical protein